MHVPVIETRSGKKASQPLERRLRCKGCRRSSTHRGLCVHERAALEDAKLLDDNGDNDAEQVVASTSTKVSYVSTLPRRAILCPSDHKAIHFLVSFIIEQQTARYNRG